MVIIDSSTEGALNGPVSVRTIINSRGFKIDFKDKQAAYFLAGFYAWRELGMQKSLPRSFFEIARGIAGYYSSIRDNTLFIQLEFQLDDTLPD